MDIQTLGMIAGVVAVVAVVLYVWERRLKQEEISPIDAIKLALGAGGVAGGVAYAVTGDVLPEQVAEVAQEMFLGKPEF
jgi:hypothetical protein